MNPDWKDSALCAEVGGDFFFPEQGQPSYQARAICAQCPVSFDCLEDALETGDVVWGIRGGLSPRARRDLLRDQNRGAA